MNKPKPVDEMDWLDGVLTEMVENTVMFLTNDLPSLLGQEEVYQIRKQHKKEILKNLPKAKAEIAKRMLEARLVELDLLEQLINRDKSGPPSWSNLERYKLSRLKDLETRLDALQTKNTEEVEGLGTSSEDVR